MFDGAWGNVSFCEMTSVDEKYEHSYTQSMTTRPASDSPTTIKVTMATRNRLKARTEKSGSPSLDSYLNALVDAAERIEKLAEFRAVMARVTPDEWASYMSEVSTMDASLTDGLSPAENWDDDWPGDRPAERPGDRPDEGDAK